jgi:DNA-binding NarL/FixJ family response regulator
MTTYQPVFATRQALRIAGVRQLLDGAGIAVDPLVVHPEELERIVMGTGDCLVIIDGQYLPGSDVLLRICRFSPGSRLVLWTDRLTTELLLATIECGLHGLLSSRLPQAEAASALGRICRGERILRFDSDNEQSDLNTPKGQLVDPPSFDAQWMLDGAQPEGRQR